MNTTLSPCCESHDFGPIFICRRCGYFGAEAVEHLKKFRERMETLTVALEPELERLLNDHFWDLTDGPRKVPKVPSVPPENFHFT